MRVELVDLARRQQKEYVVVGAVGFGDGALFDEAEAVELGGGAGDGVFAEAGAAGQLVVGQVAEEAAAVGGGGDAAGDEVAGEGGGGTTAVSGRGAGAEGSHGGADGQEELDGAAAEAGQQAAGDEGVVELDEGRGGGCWRLG
ncbi:MAG: hypothetical protein P8129_11165, partial [Anaerolineae bacterium]